MKTNKERGWQIWYPLGPKPSLLQWLTYHTICRAFGHINDPKATLCARCKMNYTQLN